MPKPCCASPDIEPAGRAPEVVSGRILHLPGAQITVPQPPDLLKQLNIAERFNVKRGSAERHRLADFILVLKAG